MSPLAPLRRLGIGRNRKRTAAADHRRRQTLRLQGLEDRVVPTIRPVMMSYLPIPIVAGEPAHIKVKATDGFTTVTTFTDNVTVTTTPGNVFLGSHHYTLADQGIFDFPVTIPASTPAGQLGVLCTDDDTGTFFPSVVDVVQPGGGGGKPPKTFNLDLVSVEVPPNDEVAPGEKPKFFLNLANNGTVTCHGKTIAHVKVGTKTFDVPITVNIVPGKPEKLPITITMPELNLNGSEDLDAGNYAPVVTIDPITQKFDGTLTAETNLGDNTDTAANPLDYAYHFGQIDENPGLSGQKPGKNIPLIAGGEKITMTGGGYGQLTPHPGGGWDLTFVDTNRKSDASTSGKVAFTLASITAPTPLGSVHMFTASAVGNLNFFGGLGGLVLANLGKQGTATKLSIASGFGAPAQINLFKSDVVDTEIVKADEGIKFLSVNSWTNQGGVNSITAPFIDKIISSGAFTPDISVDGAGTSGTYGIDDVNIKGDVSGTWAAGTKARAGIGHVTVGGNANAWNLFASGPVQDIAVGGDVTGNISVTTGALAGEDPFPIDKILVLGQVSGTWTAGDASHPDVDIGKVTVTEASNWTVSATGSLDKLFVLGDWTTGSLDAATIETLRVGGALDVNHITVSGTLSKGDESIAGMRIGTVKGLGSLTAPSGIGQMLADTWPATTNISAKWIHNLEINEKGDSFNASMNLTGIDPVTGTSLYYVLCKGTIGNVAGSPSQWTIAGNIHSILTNSMSYANITTFGNIAAFIVNPYANDVDSDASQFFDSLVQANLIGAVIVSNVAANSDTVSGFDAVGINKYGRYDHHNLVTQAKVLVLPGTHDPLGKYSVLIGIW